ncbi:MAG: ribonuclease HII [bacterium]|nr:ribonuclease HII [bacterium]MBK8130362.1 ribonuclease HII [bacterium]
MTTTTLIPLRNERIETDLSANGVTCIVGCDEAGRGPLAGPVVAAAVVFADNEYLWRGQDSKSLRPAMREALYDELTMHLRWATAQVEHSEIDHVNIRVASLLAMQAAVRKLGCDTGVILVDGRDRLPEFPQSRAIIDGDALVATIGAASIIAKVTRDRLMQSYHLVYPQYGFDRHFGYPTAAHRAALKTFGPCPIHRRSFRGVREFVEAP